jgi:hypothetical protein
MDQVSITVPTKTKSKLLLGQGKERINKYLQWKDIQTKRIYGKNAAHLAGNICVK